MNEQKNIQIANSMRATYNKRKSQYCRTYTFKVDRSSLSKEQIESIKMKFIEAKWVYNYILAEKLDVFNLSYKDINNIYHLDKDRNKIEITLRYLKSSEIQGIIDCMKQSILGLSALKKKGYTVGSLKFKSEYNSIYYKQYGLTHKIKANKIKLQGIKSPIRVNGLAQISDIHNIDYTCAKLIYNGYDYLIALTCFIDKEPINTKVNYKNDIIGIDFGCKDTITLSNGDKVKISIEESERLKKLQRQLARKQKYSNNWYKTISLIRKEYNHISNKKEDISNKIVHTLLSDNKIIVTQNDDINSWKSKTTSTTIQHSVIGRVKSKLKRSNQVVFLDQWFPTTKQCTKCGVKNDDLTLSDRTFICHNCGYTEDRDIHAANNMIYFYMKIKDTLGTSDTSKLVSIKLYNKIVNNLGVKQEDTTL